MNFLVNLPNISFEKHQVWANFYWRYCSVCVGILLQFERNPKFMFLHCINCYVLVKKKKNIFIWRHVCNVVKLIFFFLSNSPFFIGFRIKSAMIPWKRAVGKRILLRLRLLSLLLVDVCRTNSAKADSKIQRMESPMLQMSIGVSNIYQAVLFVTILFPLSEALLLKVATSEERVAGGE